MTKPLVFLLVFIGILGTIVGQKKREVTEVAIFRVDQKENQEIGSKMDDFRSHVSKLDGYQDWITLRDVSTSNIYVDILHWRDINTALTAAEEVMKGPEYQPFVQSIDSIIGYGEFYSVNKIQLNKKGSMKNKVTEVVIYDIKSDQVEAYKNISKTVDQFIKKQPGFISREVMQDHQDANRFMDIVLWESLEKAHHAFEVAQKEASLMPFFEATEKVVSFSHYNHFK